MNQTSGIITPESIKNSVDELFKLKHTGKKIQELYKSQFTAMNSERKNVNHYPMRQNRKDDGMLNYYTRKLKNFFVRNPQTSTESEEDNSSYNYKGKSKQNQKGGKKGKKKSNNYENHLNMMQQEASVALAALTNDIKL